MTKHYEWQYDDSRQVGVDYDSVEEVRKYDERMQKFRNFEQETKDLFVLTQPESESIVMEIGTGTGEFAIAFAKQVREVHALDISKTMLAYAKSKAESRNVSNIIFRNEGFLSWQDEPETYDIIFTQLALHHLSDFWKSQALSKIYRALNQGGRFFLRDVVFPSDVEDYTTYFNQVIENIGKHTAREMAQHIRQEYSTLDWIMTGLLEKAGFTITHSEHQNQLIATYLCVK